jgi:L-fucono-1,5-lactonase
MRVDAHQHFWKYKPERDSWITDDMEPLKHDFLPEDLMPELRSNNLDGCISVQADQSENETEFLLHLAAQHPQILAVVGWVDLCALEVRDSLQRYVSFKKFRGVRHILQAEPDDFMLRDAFLRGISYLKDFGLTYDVLIYSRQLPAALQLVTRFSDQRFVIDHIGKPEIRSNKRRPWAQHMGEIARNRNVYCKISGMITEADWRHWSEKEISPYLDVVFDAFGMDRVMFGSDWPVCLLAGSYTRVIGLLGKYTESFSESDRAKIFGLNAAHFYGL